VCAALRAKKNENGKEEKIEFDFGLMAKLETKVCAKCRKQRGSETVEKGSCTKRSVEKWDLFPLSRKYLFEPKRQKENIKQ